MTNHVHWIAIPEREDSLAVLFRRVHGRFAQYLNTKRRRAGHLWQNRYYSCALSPGHLFTALRYVEWNPVRARLVELPQQYRWSSAAAHCAADGDLPGILDETFWREAGGAAAWKERLDVVLEEQEAAELRRCTHSGKPFGEAEFVEAMEQRFDRHWRRPGRPGGSQSGGCKPGTEPSDPVRVLENCASSG